MGFHRQRVQTENTRTGLGTSSVPQMGRLEIPLASSACQKLLLCQKPQDISRDIQQSLEGSVVKVSPHIAHQCCWEASRTCSAALE